MLVCVCVGGGVQRSGGGAFIDPHPAPSSQRAETESDSNPVFAGIFKQAVPKPCVTVSLCAQLIPFVMTLST